MSSIQGRPAVARRISASVKATIERKKRDAIMIREKDADAIRSAGIKLKGAVANPGEIRRAHQIVNRRLFAQGIDFRL